MKIKLFKIISDFRKKQILIWSIGTNGLGSSVVVSNLIKSICKNNHRQKFLIIYSDKSLLAYKIKKLTLTNINQNIKFIKVKKFIRFYPVQLLIRTFYNPDLFFKATYVLDDFPFKYSKKQLLYFHQSNILNPKGINWHLKRIVFHFLLNKYTKVYLQTNHIYNKFNKSFPYTTKNTITFLHKY
tara:strand:+ start:483 stop:1034 length:552 start_codon:yes stop_codon:yes gene_type:complete